ncbi:cytoplasmic linker associated protein [Homalodisca vitripennis]|nr:cytoplasmic linker associated protein [Homalodisca vitripennis]
MTGNRYEQVLNEQVLPYFTVLEVDQAIFQQDGAPPHFANSVKQLLNDNLHGRLIGRGSGFLDWPPRSPDDINEIILNCESIHWCDRKEGLVGLQVYLQAGNTLNPAELKRVTDIFTRMFMDSHTKVQRGRRRPKRLGLVGRVEDEDLTVFSLFLDALNELMAVHRADLNSWLYVLLTRLLNKLGADLLGSIQSKIQRTLDIVRYTLPQLFIF